MKRRYLPIEAMPVWARLNGIRFDGVAIERFCSHGGTEKGAAVVTKCEKFNGDPVNDHYSSPETLISVPPDKVLSPSLVESYSKSDRSLKELLEAIGDYGKTARGAILVFLLFQVTYSSPDFDDTRPDERIGIPNPWSEYIKFLPAHIPLPTFYTDEERYLLYGTSLKDAVDTKIASLEREFNHLRKCTETIPWCMRYWWDEETGKLTFEDWKQVDAMYRSRALDLPGTGHAMVPCVDMANHASGDEVVALYETDKKGNAVLQLRWGKRISPGDEVTITYGNEKGASEMIFSYGFLEAELTDARQLFLSLGIPDDDPLKLAKRTFCEDAPGVRLFSTGTTGATGWDSPFVWWSCINQEDGLQLHVLETHSGIKELQATWKDRAIGPSGCLRDIIATDPLWDVFQLRAVFILQTRLETQLAMLQETENPFLETGHDDNGKGTGIRSDTYRVVETLRKLEIDLLERGIRDLRQTRDDLMASETVNAYLSERSDDANDDFS